MPRITHVLLADGLPIASWVEGGLPRDWGLAGRAWTELELEPDGQPMTAEAALRRDELDAEDDDDYLEHERWRSRMSSEWGDAPYDGPCAGAYGAPYDAPYGAPGPVVPSRTREELVWGAMLGEVGGEEALRELGADPLPVEQVEWGRVPERAAGVVEVVLARIDRALERWPDPEVRTACQRLLVSVAVTRAALVCEAEPDRTAAAVYWAVGRASHLIGPEGRALNRDVLGHFGYGSSPVATHARRLVGPVPSEHGSERYGVDAGHGTGFLLGRADLLVSSRRARLVAERDRILPLLGGREPVVADEADWEGSLRLLLGGGDE